MFTIMSKEKTSTSKDNVKERDSGGPDTGVDPSAGNVAEDLSSEPQRKASLMQRTDTILERIDAEGGEEVEPQEQEEGGDGTVPFVDIDDVPQNGTLVVGDALGNALKFLPTAREGNVFTGVCHSVHSRPDACSVTAHPCWLLDHLLRCGRYASYWNAFLLEIERR